MIRSIQRIEFRATVLAFAALTWCVVIGITLWLTPIRYLHYQDDRPPQLAFMSFAEAAGVHVLLIPAALAACAVWLSRRRRTGYLTLVAIALLLYCFVAGFSVGAAYLPAAAALIYAAGASRSQPTGNEHV